MLRMNEEHEWRERHFKEDRAAIIRNRDRMAHDMNHHLESILAMNTIEDVRGYLEPILRLSSFRIQITGNDDIDCILWPKQQRAAEKGISFNVTGLLPDDMDFLHKYDIVTLIGNGLANAIDACEKVNDGTTFINVSFDFSKHLTIQIDNPYVEPPVVKKGWFKSIKKEPGHGFGMESMREAVDRYNGHMETVIENGIFSLRILLQNIRPPELVSLTAPIGTEATIKSMRDAVRKYDGSVEHVVKDGVSSLHITLNPPDDKTSTDRE